MMIIKHFKTPTMKILKFKFALFSLLAMLIVSVFLTSCEQEDILLPIQEELAKSFSKSINGSAIEYDRLSDQQQADFSRFLGRLWGDGQPSDLVNKTGSKFRQGLKPRHAEISDRLKNMTIDGITNPFNLPANNQSKDLPDFWNYWDNSLPGGNPNDPQILRDALRNPNFLAGLIEGEGQANHTQNNSYVIDDHFYAPSHPDKTIYGMLNFGPNRMIQLFLLVGETYGFKNTKIQVANDVYDYAERNAAIAALNAKYNEVKAMNEDPNSGSELFAVKIFIDESYFDELRSYGYWELGNGFRTPAPDDDPSLNILTGDKPEILDEVSGTMSFFNNFFQIHHKDTDLFLSSAPGLKSSANDNSLIWTALDTGDEYFRVVSKDNNRWLKALEDGTLMLASTANTGLQTQWTKKKLSNGYYLLINRRFGTHLRVNNGARLRHGSSGSPAHWSLSN